MQFSVIYRMHFFRGGILPLCRQYFLSLTEGYEVKVKKVEHWEERDIFKDGNKLDHF